MNKFCFSLIISLSCLLGSISWGAEDSSSLSAKIELKDAPPKLAPIGVSYDDFFYSFDGRKNANDNIYGFENVTAEIGLLTMKYARTPFLSYSLVGSYVHYFAETNFLGTLYKDRTDGFGDTQAKMTKTWVRPNYDLVILDGGLSLPTGSIDKKNATNTAYNYAYNMQLGSGTIDPFLSAMYIKSVSKHQLGALAMGKFRVGTNSNEYSLGNEYLGSAWYTYVWKPALNPSLKFNYKYQEAIKGQDNTFGRHIFTEYYHNKRDFWDFTATVNSSMKLAKAIQLRGSFGVPVWQGGKNIDNVQLDTQWSAQIGLVIEDSL